MKTIVIKISFSLMVLFFLGCTYSGAIRTNIAPTAMVGKKYPAKVGIYFTPRLASYEEMSKLSTLYGSAHTFKFNMGPPLVESLTKSVEAAYSNVSILSGTPSTRTV